MHGSSRRRFERIGRNAASVFPAAVAAAMMTSRSAPMSAGTARSCASRSSVQPSLQIHRRIRSSSWSKLRESVEPEAGELIIAISRYVRHAARVTLDLDASNDLLPIRRGVLFQYREKIDECRYRGSRRAEIGVAESRSTMGHENGNRLFRDE